MAIGAITMILANVGLQVFNNWCGNRQNSIMQHKREEFERAAKERNTEYMWKLLREGQELAIQLEKEKHDDRLKELKEDVDHLLERLTYEATITNWPLKVLPIVMKNQAFGNLLSNQNENVALHVIFTRSNYNKFNKFVYPVVEKEIGIFCDENWSTMTEHPILFYSGAWKPLTSPSDVQITAMREELNNLPTLVISPYFRPSDGKLVFQLHMWGVGPKSTDKFDIPEIEPKSDEFHFQRIYTDNQDYENEIGLIDEIIEDIVPYLECMIGYMADTYFWSCSGLSPFLPKLLSNGTINTDGMKYLIDDSREYYDKLIRTSFSQENMFSHTNILNLLEGSLKLWDSDKTKVLMLENSFLSLCSSKLDIKFDSWDELINLINSKSIEDDFYDLVLLRDLDSIKKLGSKINAKSERIENLHEYLSKIRKEQFEIIDTCNSETKQLYELVQERMLEAISPAYFLFIVWNPNIIIGTFCTDEIKPCVFSKGHTTRFFIIRHIGYKDKDSKRVLQSYNPTNSFVEDNWDRQIYSININNKKMIKMNDKNFEEQFGQGFERIGKGLGKIFDGIRRPIKNSEEDELWGDGSSSTKDSTEQIISFFIANANKTIPAERIEDMSMQRVLDWVDNNVTPFADKVYLLKGFNKEYKKHVFCVFFGSGDKVMIEEGSPRMCFVTSQYNDEMKDTFKDNNICIIPLK